MALMKQSFSVKEREYWGAHDFDEAYETPKSVRFSSNPEYFADNDGLDNELKSITAMVMGHTPTK